MATDIIILFCYVVITLISKESKAWSSMLITCWFALSITVHGLGMTAIPTFPIYWGMAGVCLTVLINRGALLISWGMCAMFLLQALMTFDSLITDSNTSLYSNYGFLALLVNIIIILLTFLHGRGIGSVSHIISISRTGSHNNNGH